MDANERNATFEDYQNLIYWCVNKNFRLIKALQLEIEDVTQELAIRLLRAIDKFDDQRSKSMSTFLCYELQYEMLNMRRRHKPYGVTGVPKDKQLPMLFLDQPREDGTFYELSTLDDDLCDFTEAMQRLPVAEQRVVARKMQGEIIRKKADKQLLSSAQEKVTAYYQERTFNYAQCL